MSAARRTLPVTAVLTALAVAACGNPQTTADPGPTTSPPTTSTSSTTTTTSRPASPTTTATPTTTTPTAPRTTTRAAPSPSATARPTTAKPAPAPAPKPTATPKPTPKPTPATPTCAVPSGTTAAQVVLVTSSGSSATVSACRRSGSTYVRDLGPYPGHVGRNGVSSAKREGDLKTPAGTFALRGGFGANANPGLAQGWFTVSGNDVWVDDSRSPLYNTHQTKPVNGRWTSAEDLLNTPAYTYAQVIGYNESRTPGRGSAIFLHVDTGGGTAGCVSLPMSSLLSVMRWQKSGAVISIR